MIALRRLPIREPPLPGESLNSLVQRTARAMGYDNVNLLTRQLGETCRLHQNLNCLSPGAPLDRLAELLGITADKLNQCTVHRYAPALILQPAGTTVALFCDSKTILRYFTAETIHLCPACLAEDCPTYERLLWSFRPQRVCTRHACQLLVQCPACRHSFPRRWNDLVHCSCGISLVEYAPGNVSPETLVCARRLETWLSSDGPGVAGLPSAACFYLAERLVGAIAKNTTWLQAVAEQFSIDQACPELLHWTAAATLFDAWPQRLYHFLDDCQTAHRSLNTAVRKSLGPLLRDAAHLEELGYSAPADALRQYLLERYTAGHLSCKLVLFQNGRHQELLKARPWYTQTQAAQRLRLRLGTVADLVQRGILDGRIQPAGQRGKTVGVVSRNSVEALVESLEHGLDTRQTGRRLGIDRHQVLGLIHKGLLDRVVRTHRGWVVPKESIEKVEAWYQQLRQVGRDRHGWLSLREATRVYGPSGLNLTGALKLLWNGLVAARRDKQTAGLHGLWLSRSDVEAQLPALRVQQYQERGYSLVHLAKMLFPGHPVKEAVLRKWIQAGLLQAQRGDWSWIVAQAEVERFRSSYCLAEEACRLLQVSRTTLSRWEHMGRLAPVYSKRSSPRAGYSLYRRSDLQGLQRFRKLRHSSKSSANSAAS